MNYLQERSIKHVPGLEGKLSARGFVRIAVLCLITGIPIEKYRILEGNNFFGGKKDIPVDDLMLCIPSNAPGYIYTRDPEEQIIRYNIYSNIGGIKW